MLSAGRRSQLSFKFVQYFDALQLFNRKADLNEIVPPRVTAKHPMRSTSKVIGWKKPVVLGLNLAVHLGQASFAEASFNPRRREYPFEMRQHT